MSDERRKIAVVGPAHPNKGGIAVHTTELARHLAQDPAADVKLVSWSRLYPELLYPGQVGLPDATPEVPEFTPTLRPLSWSSPASWWSTGRRLAGADLVVLAHVVPLQVPALLTVLAAMKVARSTARTVVVAHNVLPHEPKPGDELLVRRLFAAVDGVVVHSDAQAALAHAHGARRVVQADLPPHLPGGPRLAGEAGSRVPRDGGVRLLSLGVVREYKGLDLLLEALAEVHQRGFDARLTIAGELWGAAGRRVRELATAPGMRGHVELREGYVPASEIAGLMAAHDAVVLPYRSGTASQNAVLAFAHGLPVLATRVGSFPAQVRDDVDGVLVEPGSVRALADGILRLADGGLKRLRDNVEAPDLEGPWDAYAAAVDHAAEGGTAAAPPGGRLLAVAKRGAEHALWTRVGVQRRVGEQLAKHRLGLAPADRPVPSGVPRTGVLHDSAEVADAVAQTARLRLPAHPDAPKNWDALGAVAAVLTLADDGSRTARVLDAGSARYSPVLPWLRLYGLGRERGSLAGINLEFGATVHRDGVEFRRGDVTDTGLADASLDAVTCMSVIEHGVPIEGFLTETARVLRPGGVLALSTDYDQDPPDTTGVTAYGAPVKIFSPADLRDLVALAGRVGLDLVGDLTDDVLAHPERPVHWKRTGLDYTFVLLTFVRR
ncbi:glycosyltransferase [Kineococcus rhizosphaerae]|uniref:Glycosyltransferase involved in cell wall biosynthesis n=1 Tax=Kineococcus rhizosphaerae TaxID=559628 RepID=A0A2T0R097_9ACTN|nr:glycosyltransferase [Kineococcus rhizosphaerae]PRY12524.1 glycosyltransferase involved in cell wall biosynthesis [Kineococcus rhizosphaerae]